MFDSNIFKRMFLVKGCGSTLLFWVNELFYMTIKHFMVPLICRSDEVPTQLGAKVMGLKKRKKCKLFGFTKNLNMKGPKNKKILPFLSILSKNATKKILKIEG